MTLGGSESFTTNITKRSWLAQTLIPTSRRIYHDDSDLIAVFLCADYDKKEWCGLELRAIRDLIKKRSSAAIMPFRFDDTSIPGLFSIDGYIDIGQRSPNDVASLILERLQHNDQ